MSRARWLRHPDDLSADARKYWNHYAIGLFRLGTLTPESAEKFKALCRLLALSSRASAEIEQHGATLATSSGGRRPNPAVAILISSQRRADELLDEFFNA